MTEIVLKNNRSKPVFEIILQNRPVVFLVDTGAELPIWCGSVELLKECYPDCICTEFTCNINGFGGKRDRASIYKIPKFKLVEFTINNLFIAVVPEYEGRFKCNFIISYTMLNSVTFMIEYLGSGKSLFKIDNQRDYYMKAISDFSRNELLRVFCFIQEVAKPVEKKLESALEEMNKEMEKCMRILDGSNDN